MVVQTLRMKIQEPAFTCDAGRLGGGGDSDCEGCEEHVPRLDLTALTQDGSSGGWGGESAVAPWLCVQELSLLQSRNMTINNTNSESPVCI